MNEQVTRLLMNSKDSGNQLSFSRSNQPPSITDLTARFRIERSLIEDQFSRISRLEFGDFRPSPNDSLNDTLAGFRVVSEKFSRPELLAKRIPRAGSFSGAGAGPRGARLGLLLLQRQIERREVDADAARAERVLRQIEREAVGIVERERGLALEAVALLQRLTLVIEDGKAALQRLPEARLFELQRLRDQRLGTGQLRIGL